MPIYDYKCNNCLREFEDVSLSTVSNAPHPVCPSCYHTNVDRLASAARQIKVFGEGAYNRQHKDTGDWA